VGLSLVTASHSQCLDRAMLKMVAGSLPRRNSCHSRGMHSKQQASEDGGCPGCVQVCLNSSYKNASV
jgi:hypothetical protein